MRNTLQYILKKLLFMIPMVLFITFLIYLGLYLTPGDAISYMFSPDQLANIDPAKLEELRELYGLNDPFFVQYFTVIHCWSMARTAVCSSSAMP